MPLRRLPANALMAPVLLLSLVAIPDANARELPTLRTGVFIRVETSGDDGPTALRANLAAVNDLVETAATSGVTPELIRTWGVSIVPEIDEASLTANYRVVDWVIVAQPTPAQVDVLTRASDRLGAQLAQGTLSFCPIPPAGADPTAWNKQWQAFG